MLNPNKNHMKIGYIWAGHGQNLAILGTFWPLLNVESNVFKRSGLSMNKRQF